MSICDPYRELELYLEQASDEITRVFEKWNPQPETKTNGTDTVLDPFLVRLDSFIDNDIKARYDDNKEYFPFNGEDIPTEILIKELCGSQSTLNDSVLKETATQTSISRSSTNLTWTGSDCSSSPCLTSASDADDNQSSSSSTESHQPIPWLREQWRQELSTKSSSAPVLKKVATKVTKQARSQSDRHLAEIEATEACKWLRAAGFPQYAQMYEDMQFPIDLSSADQDHPLLEKEVLSSLFRRLHVLNRCARVHQQRITHTDDSEDEQCALSNNWTYQSDIRRWSRKCDNMKIPTIDDSNNKEWWCGSLPHQKVENNRFIESPKEKLKRAGSSKYRRRRDGVFINEAGSDVLDILTRQLSDLKTSGDSYLSDSECTSKHRRRKTKSLEKSDSWSIPNTPERVIWHNSPKTEDLIERRTTNLQLEGARSISSLSCIQLQVLRKLALLKLTAHMEKYCPSHRTGWNWNFPKFIKKMKAPIYKDKTVFGIPLSVIFQRTGQCLPKNIEEAFIWLQQNAYDQVGLFRKPGVRSRIQMLRNYVDSQEEILNFTDQQAYDIADMVKQYFRELPEALLTNKLSETFIFIFQYVPPYLRLEALLCALLLIPDEHREVLQILLHFLRNVAKQSSINQMNESNLAMCFAPSLFHFNQMSSVKQGLGSPHPKELAENRAAHECLLYLLKHNNILFSIPWEFINQCKAGEIKDSRPMQLDSDANRTWRKYLEECQAALLREAKERNRGWVIVPGHYQKVEIAYKKVADGHPLRLWKASADIDAPPCEVLHRILRERHIWDPDLQSGKIITQVDKTCEVFQYVRRSIPPLPSEDYVVVRNWKTNLSKDACLIVETSVEHPEAATIPSSSRGIVLASRYLIEPCGSGRSRILHLSRADTRRRMPEWYHKNYGHLVAIFLSNIQDSFQQRSAGPESQV